MFSNARLRVEQMNPTARSFFLAQMACLALALVVCLIALRSHSAGASAGVLLVCGCSVLCGVGREWYQRRRWPSMVAPLVCTALLASVALQILVQR